MTGNQQVQAHLGALWTLLSQMKIEGPRAARRFEEALAADKSWSLDFAERVTSEYRRFLYLAASSPDEVTPSRAVDAAWHLHLTYSRHYWDELCARILGRPLHHNPSTGDADDDERFARQYEDTLALYRRTFGETPPADIWPSSAGSADEEGEPEGDNAVSNLALSLLSVPILLLLGAASLGGVGAILGVGVGAAIVGAFILHPPPPPGTPARRKRNAGGCGSGCGGTGSGWGGDSGGDGDGGGCGGGCGGD